MKIDIHSHHDGSTDHIKIISYSTENYKSVPDSKFSIGIHPWSIKESNKVEDEIDKLERLIKSDKPIALGELGLDKTIQTPFHIQLEYLEHQLQLAKRFNYKVIIIHCVKAYSYIISKIKNINYQGAIIFHDYNGNQNDTKQLLKYNSYFSFSKSLFNKQATGHKTLLTLDLSRIFLETDAQHSYSIKDAYIELSKVKNIDLVSIEKQLLSNFQSLKFSHYNP